MNRALTIGRIVRVSAALLALGPAFAHDIAQPTKDQDVAAKVLRGGGAGKLVLPYRNEPGVMIGQLTSTVGGVRLRFLARLTELPQYSRRRGAIEGDLLNMDTGKLVGRLEGLWHAADGRGQFGVAIIGNPGGGSAIIGVVEGTFQTRASRAMIAADFDTAPQAPWFGMRNAYSVSPLSSNAAKAESPPAETGTVQFRWFLHRN